MSYDWKGLIGGIAPAIATVVSGGNPLVGAGVSALSKAVLGHSKGTEEEVKNTISSVFASADPVKIQELQLAIKNADNTFNLEMERLGVRLEELDVKREEISAEDRKDARGMQATAMQGDDKFVRRFIYWYAIALTTLSFIYFFAVTFITISAYQQQNASIILGFLLGIGLGTIIAFFYGTSNGTLSKNKQIADMATQITLFKK